MLNKKTLNKIKNIALRIDHDLAFDGKSKGNKHLYRIVRVAKFLAKKNGANIPIVEAGALLHDTALPSGNDYNYSKNKQIVKKLLKNLRIEDGDLNKISECVASHEGTVKPKNLEAKIVHDSDVLEKTGILGLIRHAWKMTNSARIDPKKIKESDVKQISDHIEWRRKKLETETAKKIAKYLNVKVNKKTLKIIVRKSSEMASRGIITEKIAAVIQKNLNQRQSTKLKEQLNLKYLKKFS